MTAEMKLTKVALRRDNSVPFGVPARVFIICPHDDLEITVPLGTDHVTCPNCESVYSGSGWLISGPRA